MAKTTLYHGTPETGFTQFRSDRPTYFFRQRDEAECIAVNYDGRVLQVEIDDSTICSEEQALAVWRSVNGAEEEQYLYSMLCFETNEFSMDEIGRFIEALRAAGYTGVAHYDYSQIDVENDAEAICILDASSLTFTELKLAAA